MADLTAEYNANLNRIAEIKSKGGRLDMLDEQRLRDHQLRRLRRLWLQDKVISAREPLLPPKKLNFYQKLRAKEEVMWSKLLKFRTLSGYLYSGQSYHQLPLLLFYNLQTKARKAIAFFIVPLLPIYYLARYSSPDRKGNIVFKARPVYPGDEFTSFRKGDVKFDKLTHQFVPRNPEKQ